MNKPPTLPAGKFFKAEAHPDLQQTRPMTVFVPNCVLKPNGELNMEKYRAQRWHTINAGANDHAVGSHTFPDMTQPVDPEPQLIESIGRLFQKSVGTPSAARRPGHAGLSVEM